jgi:N-acetylglucosamine malate deacetylase 1
MNATRDIRTSFLKHQLKKKFDLRPINSTIRELDLANKTNVLIVAPHADDEVIGCAGLIQKLVYQGANIVVLFVTIEDEKSIVKPSYSEGMNVRERESLKAKKKLNFNEAVYLRIPERSIDNNIKTQNDIKQSILSIISQKKINAILLPNYFDMNPDHRSISKIGLKTVHESIVNNASNSVNSIFLYEIWGPVYVTHFCKLSQTEYDTKLESMQCYETQMQTVDYLSIIDEIKNIREKNLKQHCPDALSESKSLELYEFINPNKISEYLIQNT